MKKQLSIAALGIAFTSSAFAQDAAKKEEAKPAAAPKAETKPEISKEDALKKASFFFGFQMGSQLGGNGITEAHINKDVFFEGFGSGLKGNKPDFKEEEMQLIFQKLQQIIEERDKKIGEENLKKEAAFLAENAKKKGIQTTKSGLQYEILTKGEGKTYQAPKDAKNFDRETEFLVNYRGTLIDGTEFDNSPEGQPAAFGLQLVPGFAEALKMMPVGSKWKLYIPSKLGYGPQRRGVKLAPNSTLIFEVELKDIRKRPQPQGGVPFQLPPGVAPQPAGK